MQLPDREVRDAFNITTDTVEGTLSYSDMAISRVVRDGYILFPEEDTAAVHMLVRNVPD